MGWDYERLGQPQPPTVENVCANCKHFHRVCASTLLEFVESRGDVIDELGIADENVGLCIPMGRNGRFADDDIRLVDAMSSEIDDDEGCFQCGPFAIRYFTEEV